MTRPDHAHFRCWPIAQQLSDNKKEKVMPKVRSFYFLILTGLKTQIHEIYLFLHGKENRIKYKRKEKEILKGKSGVYWSRGRFIRSVNYSVIRWLLFRPLRPDSTVRLFMQIQPVDLKNMKVSAPWEWSRPAELHRELMEDFTRLHARNLSI